MRRTTALPTKMIRHERDVLNRYRQRQSVHDVAELIADLVTAKKGRWPWSEATVEIDCVQLERILRQFAHDTDNAYVHDAEDTAYVQGRRADRMAAANNAIDRRHAVLQGHLVECIDFLEKGRSPAYVKKRLSMALGELSEPIITDDQDA